ncbi:hypothetical protein [Glutamicibacter sp. HZAU]|uniref:hypothetical protein n=1 Tax=Glutamicibacter sp. HZAU TaxID=2049891 RepID=UPI000FFC1380|nr:hypothetical protein [Glutamicibacter sp. HZAU]RWZ82556.1 hypothetical protein EKH49_12240 [Glutamicibacter sp. HZAU]
MAIAGTGIRNRPLTCLLLLLPAALSGATYALLAGDLPEMTATHWSSTYPDGFTRTAVFVPVCIGLTIVGAITGMFSLMLRNKPALLMMLLFAGGLLAWSAAGVFVSSAAATALAETPETAVLGGMMVLLIACALLGIAPLWASGIYQQYTRQFNEDRQQRIDAAQSVQRTDAVEAFAEPQPESRQAEFKQTMAAPWWMWMLCLVLFAALIVAVVLPFLAGGSHDGSLASVILPVALSAAVCVLMLGVIWIRVSIIGDRFRVSSALLGIPMRTIKITDIESVTSEKINPMMWGGWGWRIIPGGSAIVMKEHEGLVFDLKNKKRFAVTIPDSRQAANVLNARMG